MKTRTKALLLSLCAIALVAVTIVGTLAFLVSEKEVKNTFTVGDVQIKLDETVVNTDGTPTTDPATREEHGNEYHLIPGEVYTKDPQVTVKAGSEASYVRMLVTINHYDELQAIFNGGFLPQYFVNDWDAETWKTTGVIDVSADGKTATYEFRYKEIVAKADTDTVLEPLFTKFTCPTVFDNEDLKNLYADPKFEINVYGHAIQAATFDDADAAWAAFDAQKAAANP